MVKLMQNKTVIITGTRRGMGKTMVESFAANGADIWAHARELTQEFQEFCESIALKYQVKITPWCFELTDYDAMKKAIKEIVSAKVPVDALINNAGITYNALFQMTKLETVREQMEVNFFAPYLLTQYILKIMIRNGKGSIVNIASTAGIDGNSGKSAYGASKAALIAMTKSIAEENGRSGIRANCIAPGVTETEMLTTMPVNIVEGVIHNSDLKRVGQTEDIAEAAIFLASDLSNYITGQVIRVDGGM